jgi:hypothetical protein
MSEHIIISRLGSPPSERGSTNGATCPEFFDLGDGATGVIGEKSAPDLTQEASLTITPEVAYDTLVHMLGRSGLTA